MASLYRDVRCAACEGKHTFHYASKTVRQAGSTYSFTCPIVGKSAWIWWLGKPEEQAIPPLDSIPLVWVAV